MKRRGWQALLILSFLVLNSWPSYSDGCFVWKNRAIDILQPEQKALIEWDGKTEKLTIETKYAGPADEMVWIVPVPGKPDVQKADLKVLESMSEETQTPYVLHAQVYAGLPVPCSAPPALVSRQKVGAYDVAVLAPVGDNGAIQWLNENGFQVSDAHTSVINRYVSKQWHIVASRIHPDELSQTVQQQLNEGTLHPLRMTFETDRCVYPMQMTALAAGPIEVLLWIRGPRHYQPATLKGTPWDIAFHGAPVAWENEHFASIPHSNTSKKAEYVTTLRRRFDPIEINDDLFFDEADYVDHFDASDPSKVAMAATQLGGWREPRGIPLLMTYLAGCAPIEAPHVRSAVWALGEICAAAPNADAEQLLADLCRRSHGLLRCESLLALRTCRSRLLTPLLLDLAKQATHGHERRNEPTDILTEKIDRVIVCSLLIESYRTDCRHALFRRIRDLLEPMARDPGKYWSPLTSLKEQALDSEVPKLRALVRRIEKVARKDHEDGGNAAYP